GRRRHDAPSTPPPSAVSTTRPHRTSAVGPTGTTADGRRWLSSPLPGFCAVARSAWVGGVISHIPPIRRLPGRAGVATTVPSGGQVAQSVLRAWQGRVRLSYELA